MVKVPNRVLVFAAHQDDETIGCGGTISKWSSMGSKVHVCFMTDGSTGVEQNSDGSNIVLTRMKEAQAAADILGVHEISSLSLECQNISDDRQTFHKVIEKIRLIKPELVITHNNICKHRDHKLTSKIVEEACWKASENILEELGETHNISDLWSFEILDPHANPSIVVDTTRFHKQKIAAMNIYVSQVGILNNIYDFLDGLTKVRGYSIGTKRGEAYTRIGRLPVKL